MSWGSHPDTLTLARARGLANLEVPDVHSLQWWMAFRKHYAEAAGEALAEYLARIDESIVSKQSKAAHFVAAVIDAARIELILQAEKNGHHFNPTRDQFDGDIDLASLAKAVLRVVPMNGNSGPHRADPLADLFAGINARWRAMKDGLEHEARAVGGGQ